MAKKIKHRKPEDETATEKPAEGVVEDNRSEEEKLAAAAAEKHAEEMAAAGIEDEFQARGFELVDWLHERPGLVLGVVASLILAGFGYGVFTVVQKSRNTEASVAYGKALEIWDADIGGGESTDGPTYKDATERVKAAREAFQSVVDKHGGTGPGRIAQLYVGHAALKAGDNDGAATAYKAFLDGTRRDDAMRFAGCEGLATALEARGDRPGAIAAWEQLVELSDRNDEDVALFQLARLYKASGEADKARKALERIDTDFPESSVKTRASELLAQLGGPSKKADGEAPRTTP